MLIVSHDRYLIDRLATEIWAIEEDELHVYPATYQAYRSQQAHTAPDETPAVVPPLPAELPPPELTTEEGGAAKPERRRLRPHEARQLRELAEQREDLEDWLARITETIDEFRVAGEDGRVEELLIEQQTAEEELAALIEVWTELTGEAI